MKKLLQEKHGDKLENYFRKVCENAVRTTADQSDLEVYVEAIDITDENLHGILLEKFEDCGKK